MDRIAKYQQEQELLRLAAEAEQPEPEAPMGRYMPSPEDLPKLQDAFSALAQAMGETAPSTPEAMATFAKRARDRLLVDEARARATRERASTSTYGLTPQQLEICRQTGCDPKTFARLRAQLKT